LDQYINLFGEHHPSTVNCMVNLATVLKDLHRYEESVKIYELAIEGRAATEGEDSTTYAMTKAMAAGAYRDLGDFDTADKYLKDAYLKVAMEQGEDNITCSAILNS